MKVSVFGSGSWGTALCSVLEGHAEVTLWGQSQLNLDAIEKDGENKKYLPGVKLSAVHFSSDLKKACEADIWFLAVPSKVMLPFLEKLKPFASQSKIVVSCTKGMQLCEGELYLMSHLIERALPQVEIACLSGPTHAEEVGQKKITACLVACQNERVGKILQKLLMRPYFRVYLSDDQVGVEAAGAYKNVIAIGAGLLEGRQMGSNAVAALISRSLAEMSQFVETFGGKKESLYGLAGIGDIITTVFSKHSRNRFVGYHIGQGKTLDEVTSMMSQVAEGVRTVEIIHQYNLKKRMVLPIASAVYDILFRGKDIDVAVYALMTRPPKKE